MKPTTKTTKNIHLKREQLRVLTGEEASAVVGGLTSILECGPRISGSPSCKQP